MFLMFPVDRCCVYLLVKLAKFPLVMGIVMTVSRESIVQFYIGCISLVLFKSNCHEKFDMFLHNVKVFFVFCAQNEYYIIQSFVFYA